MNQFRVFLIKELRENLRNFRLLWIPLVFILLGVNDPLINYYLMDIMKVVGGVPEGFEMMLPDYQPEDIIALSMGQFQSIGLIILIAVFVGSISRERQNGTATLIYVRPISYTSFYLSKWIVACLVGFISIVAGFGGSVYYTTILYGQVEWSQFIWMLLTYFVWICLLLAVTIAMSAAFKTAIAATFSYLFILGGLIIDGLIGSFWTYSPWKLSNYSLLLLRNMYDGKDYFITLSISIILLILFIIVGITMSKRNASTTKI